MRSTRTWRPHDQQHRCRCSLQYRLRAHMRRLRRDLRVMNSSPAQPDEKMVRAALLRVLREHGSGRRKSDTVTVRRVNDPLWSGVYMVTIAYRATKSALPDVLGRMTGSAEGYALGVWVLSSSEAWELCADASSIERRSAAGSGSTATAAKYADARPCP